MATATRLIKKYPNRRLYDTQTSAYITLVDIKQLVLENEDFRVLDAKTNQDLTRGILLQIILEEEAGGTPLFSSTMLTQIIQFYGHATQAMMGSYLEKTMQAFVEIQHRMQDQSKTFYDPKGMQTQARSMFQKFPFPGTPGSSGTTGGPGGRSASAISSEASGAGEATGSSGMPGPGGSSGAGASASARAPGAGSRTAPGSKGDPDASGDTDDPGEVHEASAGLEPYGASGLPHRREEK